MRRPPSGVQNATFGTPQHCSAAFTLLMVARDDRHVDDRQICAPERGGAQPQSRRPGPSPSCACPSTGEQHHQLQGKEKADVPLLSILVTSPLSHHCELGDGVGGTTRSTGGVHDPLQLPHAGVHEQVGARQRVEHAVHVQEDDLHRRGVPEGPGWPGPRPGAITHEPDGAST